jgi:hypothetical protein
MIIFYSNCLPGRPDLCTGSFHASLSFFMEKNLNSFKI